MQQFSLDQERIGRWLGCLKWFAVILFPFALVFSLIYRMIQALVYGVVGLAFSAMVSARLNYDALVRLAVIAVTPSVVLNTLFTSCGLHVPFWWLICIAMTLVYLFVAVQANAGDASAAEFAQEPPLAMAQQPQGDEPIAGP